MDESGEHYAKGKSSQTQKKNATYHLHDGSKIVRLTAENGSKSVRGQRVEELGGTKCQRDKVLVIQYDKSRDLLYTLSAAVCIYTYTHTRMHAC